MVKKNITYTDFDGNKQSEDFYFNLTEAECTEMHLCAQGGYDKMIQDIINAKDTASLVEVFKDFIFRAIGKKSADGRHFYKNDDIRAEFCASPAYSVLFMELATDAKAAAAFVNGVIPNPKNTETVVKA